MESLDSNEVVTAMALDEYVLNKLYISVEIRFDMQLVEDVVGSYTLARPLHYCTFISSLEIERLYGS